MSKRWLNLAIFVLIASILLLRFWLALTRYFDADEFAHLHWAYLLSQGLLPYKDLFIYHVPFFQLSLLPLFLLPPSPDILLFARIFLWLIYLGVAISLYQFASAVAKNRTVSLLAVFVFTIFPMTFDKSLEVRPDMLMTLFFLITVFLLIRTSGIKLFFAGFCFALAVFTFPKILFTVPALTVLFLTENNKKNFIRNLAIAITGGVLPFLFLISYILGNNILPAAMEAVLRTSVIVSRNAQSFSPLLSLSPYPLVYVNHGGLSLPWSVNSALIIGSLPGLAILLKTKNKFAVFFLYFFIFAVIFLFLFPLPYLQYFVPVSAFVSLLTAVFIRKIASLLIHKSTGEFFILAISTVFFISFRQQFIARSSARMTNDEQLKVATDVLRISKPDEKFYDMIGSYVFRPDGYFICCHPYYEFADKLTVKLPTLADSLAANQTKFIVLDRTGQVFWKPRPTDLTFLLNHYLPSAYPKIYTLGQNFTCRNGICIQIDLNGHKTDGPKNQLDIVAAEKYQITTIPAGQKILLDSRQISAGTVTLASGNHVFAVAPEVAGVSIQLDR